MKRLLFILFSFVVAFALSAQTQTGYVKAKGRLAADGKVVAGKRIGGATVQVKDRSAVVSSASGDFSFPLASQNFYIQSVTKNGYVLVDRDIISKQYVYSANPLVIVLESPDEQLDQRLAAERKIRRTLQRDLQKKEDEIEALKEQNRITAEEYRMRLQNIYEQQEKDEKLIADMAERYVKVDYDQIDEFNRRVNEYILNGDLAKADSLVSSKGNINDAISELQQLRAANEKETEKLAAREKALEEAKEYHLHFRNDIADRCYRKFEIFSLQHAVDSAAHYIELRASIDTTNVQWQLDAGEYITQFGTEYDKAMRLYQTALSGALSQKLEFEVVECYNMMGIIYDKLNLYDKALLNLQQAKECLSSYPNADYKSSILNNIGGVYSSLGKYKEAMEFYTKSLDIRIAEYGEFDFDIATSYNNIAHLQFDLGHYDDALENLQKCLKIYTQAGDEFPDCATVYGNIAAVYSEKGQYERALDYYKRQLEISKTLYGDNHPNIATCYNGMANVYVKQSLYDDALDLYLKAKAIFEKIYGRMHSRVALAYSNLGFIYNKKGEFGQALECHSNAMDIYSSINGTEHPDLVGVYRGIGEVYVASKDYDNAQSNYFKALDIAIKNWGRVHGDIANLYNELYLLYYNQEDYSNALKYAQDALSVYLDVYGESHPDVATVYANIGQIYNSKEEYSVAIEYTQKALNILQNLSDDHRRVICGYEYQLATMYHKNKQYEESLQYYVKSYPYLKSLPDTNAETLKDIIFLYNNAYEMSSEQTKRNTHQTYIEFMANLVDVVREISRNDDSACASDLLKLGNAFYSAGQYDLAFIFLSEAYGLCKTLMDVNRLASVVTLITDSYYKATDLGRAKYKEAYKTIESEWVVNLSLEGNDYLLFEFDNWSIDCNANVLQRIPELAGQKRNITVLYDGTIVSICLDAEVLATPVLKFVGNEEKLRIVNAYKEWKK